ncbi:MAG TPA: hypothetical protein VE287_06270 [Actinopolymorphaceae bacterium]|nr:hypothetical protein [Actinopolymorphaceae bacterium]
MPVLSRRSAARKPPIMSSGRRPRRGLKATGIVVGFLGVMAAVIAVVRRGRH